MSIYVSTCCMGDDEEIPAPIVYQASHILPTPGDVRGGSLDLGLIPGFVTQDGWCVLGHDHHGGDDDCPCEPLTSRPPVWPYLRVAVDERGRRHATVILDRSQVETLRDELTVWLNRAVKS